MKIEKLKFPSYEYLKSLDLGKDDDYEEYKFTIFRIYDNTYCRITLNEDGNKALYADILQGGHLHKNISVPGGGQYYFKWKFNKTSYKMMCNRIQEEYERIIAELLCSNQSYAEMYEHEY